MTCKIEYVMENVTCHHSDVTITPEGDVQVNTGVIEVDSIDGDTYVWCETHQVRIHSGETHEGITLNDEWEVR
jgi:hypothetical protein